MNISRFTNTYKSARRLQFIINVFLKHGFGQIIDQIHLGRYIPFKKRLKSFGTWPSLKGPTAPERLRKAFSELGPTFIKLAQVLSSRPDLITLEYAAELKKLQDKVPAFSVQDVKRIIEEEIKLPLDRIFGSFDEVPVAAASIAQVHYATLIEGLDVVVKVQRPDIREQIESDIKILSAIARLLEKHVPESKFFNPTGIIEEFSKTVRKELDFAEEARSVCRFRRNFQTTPEVYVPAVYHDFVTERVIVLERIDGVRIDDISAIDKMGLDRRLIAKTGVNAYFKQILEDGFFHADPHSGNILVRPDGTIAFLDFGIMGRVTDDLKEAIAKMFLALIEKDFDRLIDQYAEMGIIHEEVDMDVFRKEFKADLADLLEPLYGATIKEVNFAKYLDIVTHLAIKHNLKTPSDLLLINKAIIIVDNLGRQLDPNFDFFAAAEPYANKFVSNTINPSRLLRKARNSISDMSDAVFIIPKQLRLLMKKVLKDELQIKMHHVNLPEFIKDMDKASNRISFAMIVSSIIVSSAIMHMAGVGPKIFGVSLLAVSAFIFASFLGIWLLISIIRSGRL